MEIKESRIKTYDVFSFVTTFPQKDASGRYQYLIACGTSLDLIMGRTRPEVDIDIVSLNTDPEYVISFGIIDVRTPERFWGNLNLDPEFLQKNLVLVPLPHHEETTVACVHPAITLVQKCSSETNPPREKELEDARQIFLFLQKNTERFPNWQQVLDTSLKSLGEFKAKDVQKIIGGLA